MPDGVSYWQIAPDFLQNHFKPCQHFHTTNHTHQVDPFRPAQSMWGQVGLNWGINSSPHLSNWRLFDILFGRLIGILYVVEVAVEDQSPKAAARLGSHLVEVLPPPRFTWEQPGGSFRFKNLTFFNLRMFKNDPLSGPKFSQKRCFPSSIINLST